MDSIFFTVKLISAVCSIILGVILFTIYTPHSSAFRGYMLGCRCLAVAYLLIALSAIILLFCDDQYFLLVFIKNTLCIAPFVALFLTTAFVVLVQPDFHLKAFLMRHLLWIGGFDAMLIAFLFWPEDSFWRIAIHYSAVFVYISFIVYYAWVFYHEFIFHGKQVDKDDIRQNEFLLWIKRTYCFVLGIAFLSVVINIYPNEYAFLVFMAFYTLFFFLFAIVYMNYARFMFPIIKKKEVLVNSHPQTEEKMDIEWNKIENKINLWIKERGYLSPGITIDYLSKEIGVNRTYLSNFINTFYQTNYNTWINSLRINESKKLMQEESRLSLSEIAERTGFADAAQFSKRFKQIEGISPSQWRK